MRKRSVWRVLLVVIIAMTLGGCASMRSWCSQDAKKEAEIASMPPPAAVREEPPRKPAAAQPAPVVPKKDRN
jgi:hypothetical protein